MGLSMPGDGGNGKRQQEVTMRGALNPAMPAPPFPAPPRQQPGGLVKDCGRSPVLLS
jgi:hypothetical protein